MLLLFKNELAELLRNIESNNLQISSHKTNASVANTTALAAYLLTSNSKNKATRTIGQVGALGGIIFGSGEKNKAENIKRQNLKLINNGVELVSVKLQQSFQYEQNQSIKDEFLNNALELSMHLDGIVKEELLRISKMHSLTKSNRSMLLSLQNNPVFRMKLKLNNFFLSLDQSINGSGLLIDYQKSIRSININKLEKESLLMAVFILCCALLGFVFVLVGTATTSVGWLMLVLSFILYFSHIFIPWLSETKKLRIAVKSFSENMNKMTGIQQINYR